MTPASMLPRGTRVDRYELDHLLGEGAYGAVYRARHVLTEQWVALKILRCEAEDSESFDRLIREARAVAQVGSARVVRVFDCGVSRVGPHDDQLGFLSMELLAGCDLAELVRREGPFGIERAVDLVVQMLEGLSFAHDRGVVHRDMKPANVFVTRTEGPHGQSIDFVKLLDFGISKMRRPDSVMTAPGLTMGTPGYIAPEQIGNARDVDARADLFSVAVILYELLTREKPYTTRSYHEFVTALQEGNARPIRELAPAVPESLARVVERGLSRDPDARWQTARTFATALRAIPDLTLPSAISPALRSVTPPVLSAAATPTLRRDDTPAPSELVPPTQATGPRPISVTAPTLTAHSNHASQPPQGHHPLPSYAPSHVGPRDRMPLLLLLMSVAIAVAAISGGIGIYLAMRAPTRAPDQTAVDTQKKNASDDKTVAEPKDDDDESPKTHKKKPDSPVATPDPEETASAGGLVSTAGVDIEEPRVIGSSLDSAEVRRVLKKAITSMDECRRSTKEHVMGMVHVHPVGKITLVGAAPDNKGNAHSAACVAERFKTAATGWKQPADGSGIIFFEVDLEKK